MSTLKVDTIATRTGSGNITASNTIVGNVTGNITGNVTGNLTGNSTVGGTLGVTGNTTITSGNLVIATAGNGIDFSAASGSASGSSSALLDDYEEGTTTFTVQIGGTVSPNSSSYSFNTAPYVRIGRQVFCQISMNVSWSGSTSGGVQLVGLPFTEGQGGGYREAGISIANTSVSSYVRGGLIASTNKIVLYKGHSSSALNGTDLGTGFWMHGSVTYMV